VIRLKASLGISSDEFLEKYVDVVLRSGNFFPDVLLRMAENREMVCPFLSESGCIVYTDRPDACRSFPVEQGLIFDEKKKSMHLIHFYRPPDFCMGQHETKTWTPKTWEKDQQAEYYHHMTAQWAKLKGLFHTNPWKDEGPEGKRAKMAFMAIYNVDRFRSFIFDSSFLSRYKLKASMIKKIERSDTELLKLGFEWVKFFLWGIASDNIRPKHFNRR
jgi:Fe-S-cluster containining protein